MWPCPPDHGIKISADRDAEVTSEADRLSEIHPGTIGSPAIGTYKLKALLLKNQACDSRPHLPGSENQNSDTFVHTV